MNNQQSSAVQTCVMLLLSRPEHDKHGLPGEAQPASWRSFDENMFLICSVGALISQRASFSHNRRAWTRGADTELGMALSANRLAGLR
jgi:hypothetical protein